ncbi:MAG TPA: NUDIX hydrolase [Candidatus Bathyarchaeia archaeon]
MKRLPAEIIDLFKRWGRTEVHEVVQQANGSQPASKETRFGAGVVAATPRGEYVLLRHSYDLPGISRSDWNPPGGKVEANESFEDAAVREANEETGCEVRLTSLYKVFHLHHVCGKEKRGEWYMVMFRGLTESVPVSHTNPEIAEIKLFRELPGSFAGNLNRYYRDLY